MKAATVIEKTIARLRERRESLLAEVATIDRMLDAANGTSAQATITVAPKRAADGPPSLEVPFYPVLPPVVPHYPQPSIGPNWAPAHPAFPFGEILCGGTLPVNMDGQSVFARIGVEACGGLPLYSPINGTFILDGSALTTMRGPISIAAGSH